MLKKIRRLLLFLCIVLLGFRAWVWYDAVNPSTEEFLVLSAAKDLLSFEPSQVRKLRRQEYPDHEEGRVEYYYQLLSEEEKKAYRQMLESMRAWENDFFLTIYEDEQIDRVFHAVLNDHPELFWVRNRNPVYKTLYTGQKYCSFSPGYGEKDEKMRAWAEQVERAIEKAFQEVSASLPAQAGDYEKASAVYTYVIDHTEYVVSENDQNIAGVFLEGEAVCAGYASAVQLFLERLGVECIYVEGNAKGNEEGHAWNIAKLDGAYYYIDATNGDQPDFLIGDAASLAENKTILMDYLCPFPEEYEETYTPLDIFPVPACSSRQMNFYVLHNGCFDTFDSAQMNAYFHMRMDYGAVVVRCKFSNKEAFDEAVAAWGESPELAEAIQYYMIIHGLDKVQYHYGMLEKLLTMYYIF